MRRAEITDTGSWRKVKQELCGKVETLELAFGSKSLRAICENQGRAKLELGDKVAEMLKHRLADFRAAKSVKDLLAGRPRLLNGTGRLQMIVDLCDGWEIIFAANHTENPTAENGDLDWERVSRIKILQIRGDHGQ